MVNPLQADQARLLLEASKQAMLIIDARGGILFANVAAAGLFGYAPDELIGVDVDELAPPALRDANHQPPAPDLPASNPRAMADAQRSHAVRKDGTELPVEISLSPLELEGQSAFLMDVFDISERLQRETFVHAANELNQQIIASVNEGIIVFDEGGRYKLWNPFMETLTGIPERNCIGRLPHEVFPFLSEAGVANSIRRALQGETIRNPPFQWSVPQSDREGWAVSTQAPLRDRNGEVVGVIDIVHDITEAKRAQGQLELAATVYKAIGEAIVVADADNRIVAVNPTFTKLTGYSEGEAVGRTTNLLNSGKHPEAFYRDMWMALEAAGHWEGEIWNRHKSGEICHEWLAITSVYGDEGQLLQRIGTLSDITDRKRTAQTIWQQANFDPLTGLPNRRMFNDRLAQELKQARRNGRPLALMFLDLDLFKEINDTLGHDMGDLVLEEAARRLLHCVRETDTVARLGGDEFTVILADQEDLAGAKRVAASILKALAEPFVLGEDTRSISASVGISLYPADADTAEALLKNADRAMYAAKSAGRNLYRYFSPAMG